MNILIDLRPCHQSYSGIPHDTRMLFKILSGIENVKITGHIVSSNLATGGFKFNNRKESPVIQTSKFITKLEMNKENFLQKTLVINNIVKSFINTIIYKEKLFTISNIFNDYIWKTYFDTTMAINDISIDKINFVSSSMPYQCALIYNSILKGLSSLDTSSYDYYIGQPPFAFKISKKTKLILRWHDSIPITHVHTISNKSTHNSVFIKSLNLNKNDALFVCNSYTTEEKLHNLYPALKDRTAVAYCCVEKNNTNIKYVEIDKIINKYSRGLFSKYIPYILAVGTFEPRKNYEILINAWYDYILQNKIDLQLVIVGNEGWEYGKMEKETKILERTNKLFHRLKNVRKTDLEYIYEKSSVLIVASFEEGFSYSGVEAMIHKTPVIASDIQVHREIYGDNAEYFSPYDSNELSDKIYKVMKMSKEEKGKIVDKAFQFVQKYSLDNCMQQWNKILR